MANLALVFDILARDRASHVFDKVGQKSDGLGSKLGKLGKGALIGVASAGAGAAVAGIGALGAAMVQGVKDAASYQKLADKTAAVLKSTGNVAHQSVKGIQARAGALESLSGVDEEVIINGQNVLATFTNIRDGVGKGNDVFNQATKAALNMSTALGTDMQGSVIQLGKALNDPIKGVTALQKVGVSFTADQKKQIQTLVESGKTLDAQKLILGELNKEFGGAAEAAGKGFEGAMARAKDAVGDAFRAIGTKLLPVLTKVADYVASHAGPFIDRLSDGLGRVANAAKGLFQLLVHGDFTGALRKAFNVEEDSKFVTFILKARDAVLSFVGWVTGKLWPAIEKGVKTILPALKEALHTIADGFKMGDGTGAKWADTIKKIGNFIVNNLIPFIALLIREYLPIWASQVRVVIETVKLLWRAFETLMGLIGRVIAFILRRFADLSDMWSAMLRALSKVPGFGWAKDAADKLDRASGKAKALASAIERIPNKKNVDVHFTVGGVVKSSGGGTVTGGRIALPGGGYVNLGQRAKGGPVFPGALYQVGDNPDGSWNRTTELFAPATAGRIINQEQIRAAVGGGSAGGDGYTRLHPQDIAAIVDGIARRPNRINAGLIGSALAAGL